MEQKIFTVKDYDMLVFKVHGNFTLSAWDKPEMEIQADEDTLRIDEGGSTFRVVAFHNCRVSLPAGKKVQIEKVGGDAWLKGYPGLLEIERVNGHLVIEDVATVAIEKVGGEMSARRMASLDAGKVSGSCFVEEIRETLKISVVGGQFQGQQIQKASIERVGGDAVFQAAVFEGAVRAGGNLLINFGVVDGPLADLSAGGNVRVGLPSNAQVNMDIRSGGNSVVIDLAGKRVDLHERLYTHSMGEGLPKLAIRAGGNVRITDEPWTQVDFSGHFKRSERGAESWTIPGMAAGLHAAERAVEQSQRIAEMAARTGVDAARMAEERVQEVMRGLDIRFGGEASGRAAPADPAQAPSRPEPAAQPEAEVDAAPQGVSEDERLLVLKMLQEKKIDLQEAERLLDALEWRPE